jgi:hypothetical protein
VHAHAEAEVQIELRVDEGIAAIGEGGDAPGR